MLSATKTKIIAAGALALALLLVPAPLIPPNWMADAIQSALGVSWKAAYFASAVGLQALFYAALGVLAGLTLNRAATLQKRVLQIAIAPLLIVGIALILRSLKLGHLPMPANAAVPIAACFLGVGLGLGLLYRKLKIALPVVCALIAIVLWMFLSPVPSNLSRCTQASLQSLVAASPGFPQGDARFGAVVQSVFAAPIGTSADAVQQNRGAILALGIALGHERLCRCAGLDQRSELVREAVALRQGTALRGREDWARHYTLSAALAVWQHPLISDAGGLIKEQLDALTHGSGFSFGDLAADRAGVKFAEAATRSETDAQMIRGRLQQGFVENDFFPRIDDLPENLTVEEFRSRYGGVGGPRYREQLEVIEQRLSQCAALAAQH